MYNFVRFNTFKYIYIYTKRTRYKLENNYNYDKNGKTSSKTRITKIIK